MGQSVEVPRVTVAEAARMIAKSQTTIREWLKEPGLDALRNEQGWWLIDKSSLLAKASQVSSQRDPRIGATVGSNDVRSQRAVNNARPQREVADEARTRDLIATVGRERQINDELRQQNRELQGEILKMAQEMKAILSGNTGNTLMRWVQHLKK